MEARCQLLVCHVSRTPGRTKGAMRTHLVITTKLITSLCIKLFEYRSALGKWSKYSFSCGSTSTATNLHQLSPILPTTHSGRTSTRTLSFLLHHPARARVHRHRHRSNIIVRLVLRRRRICPTPTPAVFWRRVLSLAGARTLAQHGLLAVGHRVVSRMLPGVRACGKNSRTCFCSLRLRTGKPSTVTVEQNLECRTRNARAPIYCTRPRRIKMMCGTEYGAAESANLEDSRALLYLHLALI